MSRMRIFDVNGNRLYLTKSEVHKILMVTKSVNTDVRTFVETLVYTGCRISEALNLVPKNVHHKRLKVTFNSLKKSRNDIYRDVPVPQCYMDLMVAVHGIPQKQLNKAQAEKRIWTWTRQHACELVKNVMVCARISPGSHRTPKGLRHAFGINAVSNDIPLTMLQKWMGHSMVQTTAVYCLYVEKDEASFVRQIWADIF